MRRIKIGNKYVGRDDPCLVMVDAGVNHNNDIERAKELIRNAAESGADIIKFQTYKAETIATKVAPRYWDPRLDTDGGGSQYDTFSRVDDLPLEAYYVMKKLCQELKIILCSTPFNLDDAKFLKELDMDAYKISSSDITYPQLIREVARIGKPVILSTGTASVGEIEEAMSIIHSEGNEDIILQHCILSYPCRDEDANLAKMIKLQKIFEDIPVGYSDHTLGTVVPITAVAMGARTVEKHFTIDKSLPDSPDHSLSLDPYELREMVSSIRRVEKSKGFFINGRYDSESKAYMYARKSVVAMIDIPKGTVITEKMLICKRPGTGIYPKFIDLVLGRIAKADIKADTTLTFDMII
jgi:N,N'-diacetyllegionaminate synthase